jgi:glucose-6-phosphate 1-dehydrogenase
LAARVKRAGEEFVGEQRELLLPETQRGQEAPYERLLGEAMAGDGTLFTREESVEAAWAVVEPVLASHHRMVPYQPDTWGPSQADKLIAPHGRWDNPTPPTVPPTPA